MKDRFLFFHEDMDGLLSGMLLSNYIKSFSHCEAVNYHIQDWQEKSLPLGSVIVDFQFNPTASMWFDHHPTGHGKFSKTLLKETLSSPMLKLLYNKTNVWFPYASSCVQVIHDWLKDISTAKNHSFTDFENDIVRWANIIDKAKYASPKQAVECKEPALKVLELCMSFTGKWQEMMERHLMKPFENWEDMYADGPMSLLESDKQKMYEIFKKNVVQGKHYLYIDYGNEPVVFHRYFPYYYNEKTKYAVQVYVKNDTYYVSLGKNPWLKKISALIPDIGQYLKKNFGGGGYETIGGVNLESKEKKEEVVQHILGKLNDS